MYGRRRDDAGRAAVRRRRQYQGQPVGNVRLKPDQITKFLVGAGSFAFGATILFMGAMEAMDTPADNWASQTTPKHLTLLGIGVFFLLAGIAIVVWAFRASRTP